MLLCYVEPFAKKGTVKYAVRIFAILQTQDFIDIIIFYRANTQNSLYNGFSKNLMR